MKKLRKVLALVLAICMITGSMTVSAYAEEPSEGAVDIEAVETQITEEGEEAGSEDAELVLPEEEDRYADSANSDSLEISTKEVDAEEADLEVETEVEETSALAGATMPSTPSDGTVSGSPFVYGTAGSNSFRIPAMVTLSDGTLVAAADARWNCTYDGGCGDTIVARSTNNGASWSYTFANYLGDNGNVYDGDGSTCFIDPALAVTADDTIYMLVDLYPYGIALNGSGNTQPGYGVPFNSNGTLKLTKNGYDYSYYLSNGKIYDSSNTAVSDVSRVDGYFNVYNANGDYVSNLFFRDSPYDVMPTGYLYLTSSTDGGASWSEPLLINNVKTGSEQACLVGPGRGTVLSDGTIIFPVYSYAGEAQECGFIYSTDGVNWNRTYSGITSWSSESAIVELNASTLRVFYRNGTTKICYVDVTKNGNSYSWGSPVQTNVSCNSNTQLSAIKVREGGVDYILVSNPSNASNQSGASYRTKGQIVTFKASDMSVVKKTSVASVHSSNSFMYSCLSQLSNGDIAILYEDQENAWGVGANCYYQMSYKTFSLEELGIEYNSETPAVTPTVTPSEPAATATAVDETTGISVTSSDGTVISSISVEPAAVSGLSGNYVAYDITLNGGSYTDAASVTLPLNETLRAEASLTGFVVETDGSLTNINGTKNADGSFTFIAPHFSVAGVMPLSDDDDDEVVPDRIEIELTVGDTSDEMIVSESRNYGSKSETTADGVASYVQVGTAGQAGGYTYSEASNVQAGNLGATSATYTKTNYYYYVNNNYYPVYARYYSDSTKNWFYVGYSTTDSASNVTQIGSYKYQTTTVSVSTRTEQTAIPASTTIQFKGISEGTTSVIVGGITFVVSVSAKTVEETKNLSKNASLTLSPEVPEGGSVVYSLISGGTLITLNDDTVIAGATTGTAKVKAEVKASNGNAVATYTYTIKVLDAETHNDTLTLAKYADTEISVTLQDGQTVEWTSADASIAGVGAKYNQTQATNGAIVVGNGAGTTVVTGTVKNADDSIAAIYTWNTTVTDAEDTNTSSKYIYVNVTQIENCTVYYAINGGELTKINGTGVLIDDQKEGHFNIMFFADPDDGYALTYMCVTGSAKQYYVLSNGNADGTASDAWPFVSDTQSTIPSSSSDSEWKTGHGFRWSLLEGNMTINRMKAMFAQAIALGCDGATNFTKNKDESFYTEVQFVAQPMPTIEKEIVSITSSNGNSVNYTEGTKVELGDTINYKVTVTKPAYETGQVWSENKYTVTSPITDSNKPTYTSGNYGTITYDDEVLDDSFTDNVGISNPAMGTSGASDQTYTYNTSLTIDMSNYAEKVQNGTITNTATLDYNYKSQYSTGKSSAKADAKAEVEVQVPEYVVDFGLPVEISLGTEILGTSSITSGTSSYGTITSKGTSFTYTPFTTLKGRDHVTLRLSNGNSYGVNIYPASTVYYEEGFADYTGSWTGSKGSALQNTAVLGADTNVYGYDAAYAGSTGNSAGSAAASSVSGDKAAFSFTGTGVDIYGNCDKTSGNITVTVRDTAGTTKYFGIVNTASINGKTDLTDYPAGDLYNVPITSVTGLANGTYTVSMAKIGGAEVTLDGYKVYNTLEDSSVYTGDLEDNPAFLEARDLNFGTITLSDYDSRYASDLTGQIYKKITETENVNAVIISDGSSVRPSKDLIDNGPKNEIYLYEGMSLMLNMNTDREVQVGLRGLQQAITCQIGGNNTALSTVDMFYTVKEKHASSNTITITNPAGSGSILAVTKIKVCDDPGVLSSITEQNVTDTLLALAYDEASSTELAILQQPVNCTAKLKDKVSFSVVAENAAAYQWQYSKDGKKWYKSGATGATTDTLFLTVSSTNETNRYRCKITGLDGSELYTDIVAVTVQKGAKIICQPGSVTAKSGETVCFMVGAENVASYQWYYSKDGKKWYKSTASGATTETLTIKVSSSNMNNLYKCKLTGFDGKASYTNTVGLNK